MPEESAGRGRKKTLPAVLFELHASIVGDDKPGPFPGELRGGFGESQTCFRLAALPAWATDLYVIDGKPRNLRRQSVSPQASLERSPTDDLPNKLEICDVGILMKMHDYENVHAPLVWIRRKRGK